MTSEVATSESTSASPPPGSKPWHEGIGPRYVALFLSILFFDRLAPATLRVGGLFPSLLGAVVAGLLCFGLLYFVPARLGCRTRKTFLELAARTFGSTGARFVPALVIALAQVAWLSVTIDYGVGLTMRALVACGLLDAGATDHAGLAYQLSIVFWIVPAAILGPMLVHLVAAIMYAYIVFPALVFGGLMLWALGGVSGYQQIAPGPGGSWLAFATMVQLVAGYFATAGASAADWGAVSRNERDIKLGGLVGVAIAPIVIVCVAFVTIIGLTGRHPEITEATYSAAVIQGIGGWRGGVLVMFFTMALLGPACYTPTDFCRSFQAVWPGPRRWVWSLVGMALAWLPAALGWAGRLELIFGLIGAAVAPLIGAVTADALRDGKRWAGPRAGVAWSGVLAWLLGTLVGLVPYIGPELGISALARVQPAVLLAFATAFLVELALGRASRSSSTLADLTPAT